MELRTEAAAAVLGAGEWGEGRVRRRGGIRARAAAPEHPGAASLRAVAVAAVPDADRVALDGVLAAEHAGELRFRGRWVSGRAMRSMGRAQRAPAARFDAQARSRPRCSIGCTQGRQGAAWGGRTLECCSTSIFLTTLRREEPYRVPYLPQIPTWSRRQGSRVSTGGGGAPRGRKTPGMPALTFLVRFPWKRGHGSRDARRNASVGGGCAALAGAEGRTMVPPA